MLHKFQTVFLAVLLLMASRYGAAVCVVGPCHPTHAAQPTPQPPPCHQHQEGQPQPQNDDAQSCLHSQLVMDSQSAGHMVGDVVPAPIVAVLPVECTLVPQLASIDAAILHSGPPPPWPALALSTSLRI